MIGNEKKSTAVYVRLTTKEAEDLKTLAAEEKISVSSMIRRLTIKKEN
jgi:hypothetical protein